MLASVTGVFHFRWHLSVWKALIPLPVIIPDRKKKNKTKKPPSDQVFQHHLSTHNGLRGGNRFALIHTFKSLKSRSNRVYSRFSSTHCQKLGGGSPGTARSYLGVLEKGRDASDVQAEASRGASRSVNAGSEEGVVLLPRGHAPRAHQRRNPHTQGHAHVQAPAKHGPAPRCI